MVNLDLQNYLNTLDRVYNSQSDKELIYDEREGIKEASNALIAWEKFKGSLGAIDHSHSSLISLHAVEFIDKGIELNAFNNKEQVEKISEFAYRTHLLPPNAEWESIQDIDVLIEQMGVHLNNAPLKPLTDVYYQSSKQRCLQTAIKVELIVAGALAAVGAIFIVANAISGNGMGEETPESKIQPKLKEFRHLEEALSPVCEKAMKSYYKTKADGTRLHLEPYLIPARSKFYSKTPHKCISMYNDFSVKIEKSALNDVEIICDAFVQSDDCDRIVGQPNRLKIKGPPYPKGIVNPMTDRFFQNYESIRAELPDYYSPKLSEKENIKRHQQMINKDGRGLLGENEIEFKTHIKCFPIESICSKENLN